MILVERFLEQFGCCSVKAGQMENTVDGMAGEPCCSVKREGGQTGPVGITGLSGNGVAAEPADVSQYARPPPPDGFPSHDTARSAEQSSLGAASPGDDARGGPSSVRSNASLESTMSAGEKEREKARLQRLVKDFAKEAVTGVAVNLVNAETARKSPHFFQMDRYLTIFSLKPKDGSSADSAVQDFSVKEVTHVYKGSELLMKAPALNGMTSNCVGLDTNRADRSLFLQFDDNYERDKFYTCLNILRMSVDINRAE